MIDTLYTEHLDNGLILRRATSADTDILVEFNSRVHSDNGWDAPDRGVAEWTRDLMTGSHPTFNVGDILVVEDPTRAPGGTDVYTGTIVSSTNLISQTWTYGGIPFGVGRIELVGTHPDYRRRGLIRSQFDVLHRWSAERGEIVQAITGIPWYYRQFGYEMALNFEETHRGPESGVPALGEGKTEPYVIRPATAADLDFIAGVEAWGQRRSLVNCVRDPALWAYELAGRSARSGVQYELRIIETPGGEPVGYLAHPPVRWGPTMVIGRYELKPGVSWWAVTPSVLRYTKTLGATLPPYYELPDGGPAFKNVAFGIGGQHPAAAVTADWLPVVQGPYAWYVRVSDVPGFLRLIAPVLEARLAASALVGHTGALTLSFYRDGLKMAFENGRIVDVIPWEPDERGSAFAQFPDLTFLQLLFGYRSYTELDAAFPDCFGNREARLLLDILFPKQASDIWPIE